MNQVKVRSCLSYDVRQETSFLFNLSAARWGRQECLSESLDCDPLTEVRSCKVGLEGNRLHRVHCLPGEFRLEYTATVALTPQVDRPQDVGEVDADGLPPEVLPYLNPSRYCESDLLARFSFEEFGSMNPGYPRVQAITDWVHDHLDYVPGSTIATTTAADVLLQRTGVCRDYAHLAVTLCRGLGIPARYVAAYAVDLDPPDFHGVYEAYLDGAWYLFDATHLAPVSGMVRIGAGRDAADMAFATLTGDAVLTGKTVEAEFVATDGESNDTDAAIATA